MADRIYHQVLAGCVGCRGATAYSNHNLPLNGRCCFAILSETHDELDEVCLQCASRPLVTIPVGLTWGAAQHLPDSSTQQFVLNVQRTLGNPTTVEIGYVGSVSRHLAYLLDENQGISDPRTVVTRGSSYENEYNLSPDFLVRLKEAYEGTRLGRQEIHAELLEDVPGALWKRDLIESYRVKRAPALNSVLVAIDPAASASETSDETGIIVVGRGRDGHLYVLEDLSGRFSPRQWAQRAIDAYHRHKADRIVAEKNNGGDMVAAVLRSVWLSVPYYGVHASRGKVPRAQPVVSLYEQGKVHHVGLHRALEDQMCTFVPDAPEGSPDRVDALVWGLTELGPLRRPPCIISLINDEPLWKQRGEPPPPGWRDSQAVNTAKPPLTSRGPLKPELLVRVRVVKNFTGTIDGICNRDFLEGEELDLPAGPHPLPDLGLVALEKEWAIELSPPTPIEKKVRVRVVKRFKGSVDGIHWRDFQEGEEVDLPATSWPGPDLGLVAIEQGWAVEVKPDTATDSSSADRNNAV